MRQKLPVTICLSTPILAPAAAPQNSQATAKLAGLDSYIEKVLKDWNTPASASAS